jgi:hemolysin activation/secretion protein
LDNHGSRAVGASRQSLIFKLNNPGNRGDNITANLLNSEGFTEAEEGSIPANQIVRARSIAGRTVLASVRFDF